jgi:hypothetical protein
MKRGDAPREEEQPLPRGDAMGAQDMGKARGLGGKVG